MIYLEVMGPTHFLKLYSELPRQNHTIHHFKQNRQVRLQAQTHTNMHTIHTLKEDDYFIYFKLRRFLAKANN